MYFSHRVVAYVCRMGVDSIGRQIHGGVQGKDMFQIYVCLMEGNVQVAISSVTAKFSGK
jgi:hypothetical protein